MSLAMAVLQKDYIITTSDLAVTFFPMDEDIYRETGEMVESGEMVKSDIKALKTLKLSDKVILMATGNSALTETFDVELKNKSTEKSTLDELRKVAQDTMRKLRSGKVDNLGKIINNLKNELPVGGVSDESLIDDYWHTVSEKINDARGLSAYLVGFDKKGIAAMVDIRSNKIMYAPKDISEGYPVAIIGDTISEGHYNFYLDHLNLPPSHRKKEMFIEQLAKINGHVSEERKGVNVSSECYFQIITKKGWKYEHTDFLIDTKQ